MTVPAHVGPLPLEELLAGCIVAFAVGAPIVRAKAKATLSRARRRGDRRLT